MTPTQESRRPPQSQVSHGGLSEVARFTCSLVWTAAPWYRECDRALRGHHGPSPILLGAPLSVSDAELEKTPLLEAVDLNDRPLTLSRAVFAALFGFAGAGMLGLGILHMREGMTLPALLEFLFGAVGLLLASSVSGIRPIRLSSAMLTPGRVEVVSPLGSRIYHAPTDRACVYLWARTPLNASANAAIVLGQTRANRAMVITDHDTASRFHQMWTESADGERAALASPRGPAGPATPGDTSPA